MTGTDYERKLDEVDRLLNDPDAPLQPHRVWALLAEISLHDIDPPAAAERAEQDGHAGW